MSQSGYTPWSVTAGEIPTTAFWNILGSNDSSFNSGNGFNDGSIVSRHLASGISVANVESNPYKFSVYRSAALTTTSSVSTSVPFDTALFDTGPNYSFAGNDFIATINGLYFFNGFLQVGTAVSNGSLALYKNGSTPVGQGEWNGSNNVGFPVTKFLQLSAGDTIACHYFTSSAVTITVGLSTAYFEGFLVSAT